MSSKTIIIGITVVTLAILFGAVFFLGNGSSSAQVTMSNNAKVVVDEKNYDFGTVTLKGGNVKKTFVIKNQGTESLKISNIKTSCHCTTAQVNIDGQVSPSFGMNSVSPWVGEILPGKEAQLQIIFDPAYHGPGGVGPIERFIQVETNDVNNKTLEFTMKGTVTN